MITGFFPLSNRLSMINENLKEGVQEQNSIGKDATGVEQNRLKTTTGWKLILR